MEKKTQIKPSKKTNTQTKQQTTTKLQTNENVKAKVRNFPKEELNKFIFKWGFNLNHKHFN
jgi:uncharacterized protein YpmS